MQAEDSFDVGWDAYQEGGGRAELLPVGPHANP